MSVLDKFENYYNRNSSGLNVSTVTFNRIRTCETPKMKTNLINLRRIIRIKQSFINIYLGRVLLLTTPARTDFLRVQDEDRLQRINRYIRDQTATGILIAAICALSPQLVTT